MKFEWVESKSLLPWILKRGDVGLGFVERNIEGYIAGRREASGEFTFFGPFKTLEEAKSALESHVLEQLGGGNEPRMGPPTP